MSEARKVKLPSGKEVVYGGLGGRGAIPPRRSDGFIPAAERCLTTRQRRSLRPEMPKVTVQEIKK